MGDYRKALDTMCERCMNHEMCMGTGCQPKKDLEIIVGFSTPKPPRLPDESNRFVFQCPHCESESIVDSEGKRNDYCPICGQAIDWKGIGRTSL